MWLLSFIMLPCKYAAHSFPAFSAHWDWEPKCSVEQSVENLSEGHIVCLYTRVSTKCFIISVIPYSKVEFIKNISRCCLPAHQPCESWKLFCTDICLSALKNTLILLYQLSTKLLISFFKFLVQGPCPLEAKFEFTKPCF